MLLLSNSHGPRRQGCPVGDAVQPRTQGSIWFRLRGTTGEDDKDRLKRILCELSIPQKTTTDGENHRSVPSHQLRKRFIIGCFDKPLE
jgi:hypothetical protein